MYTFQVEDYHTYHIGNNGYHYGIKTDDIIFDNMNPNGMSFSSWLKDLGIGDFSGIDWKLVK